MVQCHVGHSKIALLILNETQCFDFSLFNPDHAMCFTNKIHQDFESSRFGAPTYAFKADLSQEVGM